MKRRWLITLFVAFALVAAACGDDSDTGDDTTTTTGGATTTTAGDTSDTTAGDTTDTTAGAMGPFEHLDRARAGEFSGTEIEILAQWTEAEADAFNAALQPFRDQTGIEVNYDGLSDYETVLTVRVDGNNAPDIAQVAQPGAMVRFASEGQLVNLSDWINVDEINNNYISSFVDLASYEGDMYGVYYKGDLKSIVWYPVQAFADNGYEPPATWDELVALSDRIIADGNGNPWCISIEHGDASGWVATDWMEDILLRTAPVEIYDQWITHEIPFNHPEVLEAAALMSDIWFQDDYVFGGNVAINATFVGDTQTPMFDAAGPQCWMHKQAAWIPGFWPEGTEAGVDSSFFYFPPIESEFGSPVLGGGDMFVMFNDRPEVRALMEYLATSEAALPWIELGGFISPNQSVPLDAYTGYPNDELAVILAEATTFRFDASDTMPAEVGNGTFWGGMVDWVADNGADTESIFQDIEDSWPTS